MVNTAPRFRDLETHWARTPIEALAARGIISGFPDQTFRPNDPISRAQFAALIQKAFPRPQQRPYVAFTDVPANHWAANAIKIAFETGFLAGYPNRLFKPDEGIQRVQVLVALAGGLGIIVNPALKARLPELYQDASQIPAYAIDRVAEATGASMVVNHPNVRMLNPLRAATRGEVAAIIYQGLVYEKRAPEISSTFIVRPPQLEPPVQLVNVSHQREFRGVWVTSVWNVDWPSKAGLPVQQQRDELIRILDQAAATHLNAVILQVRIEGDALYQSSLEPWSRWLTGQQGRAPEPFYDPLEFAVAEAHKRNLELHAWINLYRAQITLNSGPNVAPHMAVVHPETICKFDTQLWMDPGLKRVQDQTFNVVMDIIQRYDVDGIHIDDYFYPYPIAGVTFPDENTYAAYVAAGGRLSLGDWRRDNVSLLIQRIWNGIKATKPHVKFGVSPFGIFRPGEPEQIRGLDAYDQLYSDSKKWLEQGWIDYYAPQLYWKIEPPAQSYPVLLDWWLSHNRQKRHIYVGNRITRLDATTWPVSETLQQVEISRNRANQLSLGNIFYHASIFLENRLGIVDSLKASPYSQVALVPTLSWLSQTPPPHPTEVTVREGRLSWKAPTNTTIRGWTLYQQQGTQWQLSQILNAQTTSIPIQAGTYALCTVNRVAVESIGVRVVV
ncbi:MAG: family 10 glycosylhydrolase [Desertifilum sp.]|nr:family 10 glycosylhydrolase [Desertifilum sp.]